MADTYSSPYSTSHAQKELEASQVQIPHPTYQVQKTGDKHWGHKVKQSENTPSCPLPTNLSSDTGQIWDGSN